MIKIGQTNTKNNNSRVPSYNTLDAHPLTTNNVLPPQVDRYDPSSSYTDDYIKHQQKGNSSKVTRFDMINKNYIFPEDKFKGESNYSGSYKNNVDSRIRSQKVTYPQNDVWPKGNFKGNSSYVDTYVNKQGIKSEIIKHQPQIVLGTSKFQPTSSYETDYFTKDRVQPNPRVIAPPNFVLPKGQFAANSTYEATYVPSPMKRTEQVKPREGELKVGGKFQGSSSYASEFDERNKVNRMREKATFIENDVMPKGQFKGDSTYQSNYLFNQKPTPSKQIKHPQELKVGGKFYAYSNYASNFDNKGIAVRQKITNQSNNQILPQGKFQDFTTYAGHYIENPVQRNIKYKLQGELKVNGGRFVGNTSYESDYIAKQGQAKQATISYPSNDVLPRGDFVGNSTYADNYIPSKIQRRQQYRPEISLHPTGNFQGNSTYSQHYDGGLSPPKYLSKLSQYDTNKKR